VVSDTVGDTLSSATLPPPESDKDENSSETVLNNDELSDNTKKEEFGSDDDNNESVMGDPVRDIFATGMAMGTGILSAARSLFGRSGRQFDDPELERRFAAATLDEKAKIIEGNSELIGEERIRDLVFAYNELKVAATVARVEDIKQKVNQMVW
jgi:hypothetical protein